MSVDASSGRLRIDDLAQRAEMPSGTIRFYQREGLIPPPEREGRVAYYSQEHLRRLERIRALQAQGLPLSVVGDLLAREDAGEDITAWLALDSFVFSRPADGQPVDEEALASVGVGADTLGVLESAGVLRRDGDGRLRALPGTLELTARLLEGGVPPATIAAGAERVAEGLREVAEAMAELGWDIFATERESISADQPVAEEVLARLAHLRSLAQRIVATLFRDLLDEAIRTGSESLAEETVARRQERQR